MTTIKGRPSWRAHLALVRDDGVVPPVFAPFPAFLASPERAARFNRILAAERALRGLPLSPEDWEAEAFCQDMLNGRKPAPRPRHLRSVGGGAT